MPLRLPLPANRNMVLSHSYHRNQDAVLNHDLRLGEKTFRIFTILWLLHRLYLYITFLQRPEELYSPLVYFAKFFVPAFPGIALFLVVWLLALGSNIVSFYRSNVLIRIVLVLALMWLNIIEWGYGSLAGQGHLFLLAHFLLIFLPTVNKNESDPHTALMARMLYAGLLVTYTFAGIWKLLSAAKNILVDHHLPLWLNSKGMLYNTICLNLEWDIHLGALYTIFQIPVLWQVMILYVMFIQTVSITAAKRIQLIPIIAVSLMGMHLFNAFVIQVDFYVATFTLAALFWPYFFRNHTFPEQYTTEYAVNSFKRIYKNQDTDEYLGFYAKREMLYENKKWYAGILYFPGVAFSINRFFF